MNKTKICSKVLDFIYNWWFPFFIAIFIWYGFVSIDDNDVKDRPYIITLVVSSMALLINTVWISYSINNQNKTTSKIINELKYIRKLLDK